MFRRLIMLGLAVLVLGGVGYGGWHGYRVLRQYQAERSASREVADRELAQARELRACVREGRVERVRALLEHQPCTLGIDAEGNTLLHVAVLSRRAETVGLLLEHGAAGDLNSREARGRTPLALALQQGDIAIARLLLEHGAHQGLPDVCGVAPLQQAVSAGNAAAVALLVEYGADVNTCVAAGKPLLAWALESGDQRLIRELLSRGADPDAAGIAPARQLALALELDVAVLLSHYLHSSEASDADLDALLLGAIRSGKSSVVPVLLEAGASAVKPTEQGTLPLHEAAKADNAGAVAALVQGGAVASVLDRYYGFTPLHFAALDGAAHAVVRLLQAGAAPDAPDASGRTPLLIAVLFGQVDAARALLEHGADMAAAGEAESLVRVALQRGDARMLDLLAVHGAALDPRKTGCPDWLVSTVMRMRYSAIDPAVIPLVQVLLRHGVGFQTITGQDRNMFVETIAKDHRLFALLLQSGFSLSHGSQDYDRAFRSAIRWGNLETARYLLQLDGDLLARQKAASNGAVMAAVTSGKPELVAFVLEKGLSANEQDITGRSPLHLAVQQVGDDAVEMVRLLLKAGADPFLRDKSGATPYEVASEEMRLQMRLLARPSQSAAEASSDVPGTDQERDTAPL